MIDILIIFLAALVCYLFMRSFGGRGANINAQMPPASTPEGKRARIEMLGILCLMAFAFIFVVMRQDGDFRITGLIVPFIIGVLVFLIPYIKNRK